MAVVGSEAKAAITNKILSTFEGSFVNGKEIRIPCQENGVDIEVKVSLVAARDLLGPPKSHTPLQPPPFTPSGNSAIINFEEPEPPFDPTPTKEEIDLIQKLKATFNL